MLLDMFVKQLKELFSMTYVRISYMESGKISQVKRKLSLSDVLSIFELLGKSSLISVWLQFGYMSEINVTTQVKEIYMFMKELLEIIHEDNQVL